MIVSFVMDVEIFNVDRVCVSVWMALRCGEAAAEHQQQVKVTPFCSAEGAVRRAHPLKFG